ncbi:MAG: hypothetical protein ABSE55_16975 [Terracidiphilus sp.]|jgi:uncharacterized membrane protein
MNEPLHPSTLGEILDRTAQLYRARFLLFLSISVIPTGVVLALACVVALVVAWWSAAGAGTVSTEAGYVLVAVFAIAATLVALPILLAATSLAMAAMSHAVSRVNLGETTTIRDAYRSVWNKGWRYVGLYLLLAVIIGGIPMAAWIAMIFLAVGMAALGQATGAGSVIGVLVGIGAFVVVIALIGYVFSMVLRLSLAFPACVVEQIGARAAVKRSSILSKGTKGRIFVLFLLAAVLSWMLSMGVTLPLTIIIALLPGMSNPQHAPIAAIVIAVIGYGAAFAVQALIGPVYGIALVLFYYDQRIRLEGFDIEWMMRQAGMVAAPTPTQEAAPWLPAVPIKTGAIETEPPQTGESA